MSTASTHAAQSQAQSGFAQLLHRLTVTENRYDLLALRLTFALVMFPHGAQKLLGWFGGYGFSGTMGFFTETMGLPAIIAFLVIMLEFFGPLALLVGVFSRAFALGLGGVMLGAIVTAHGQFGFFMNWSGAQAGEGFEYHLLVLGMALALVIGGSGAYSVDQKLSRS